MKNEGKLMGSNEEMKNMKENQSKDQRKPME